MGKAEHVKAVRRIPMLRVIRALTQSYNLARFVHDTCTDNNLKVASLKTIDSINKAIDAIPRCSDIPNEVKP